MRACSLCKCKARPEDLFTIDSPMGSLAIRNVCDVCLNEIDRSFYDKVVEMKNRYNRLHEQMLILNKSVKKDT